MNVLNKKIIAAALTLAAIFTPMLSQPVYAGEAGSSEQCDASTTFLGLVPWNCGANLEPQSEDDIKNDAAIIASNVLTDLTVIAAYLVIGYVIYGGYLYMFSDGDPTKAISGKKTLLHAFIGLAIVLSANIILSSIRIALLGNSQLTTVDSATASTMVTNLIQWVVGIAGVVAAIFLVIGGISYATSAGDSNKLQKAKNTIMYALIGLAIVALAEIITAFVSNTIRNAQQSQNQETSYIETIRKES